MNNRKLILYIACSLDGYIAKPNDDLGFLEIVQKEGEDYSYNDFVSTVDTVIIGRKTYDWVTGQGFEFPHSDKETYIITRQEKPNHGNLTFYNGDLKKLVHELKAKNGKNIFCDGGSEIVNQLLSEKLFDELIRAC
jgi:dihydrofolate reductase